MSPGLVQGFKDIFCISHTEIGKQDSQNLVAILLSLGKD